MPAGPTDRMSALQLIDHSLFEPAVRIHAPIAQKWPMRAMLVDAIPFHIGHHNLFSIDRTFRDDLAARTRHKTLSPKLNSIAAGRYFMTDPVHGCDITAIRNRMTALNYLPGRMLRCAEFFLFAWMPADGCWVKNNLRAPQCRKP